MKTLLLILIFPLLVSAQEKVPLKPLKKIPVKVKEPSDLALSRDGSKMYLVSDNGGVYECAIDGSILRSFEKDVVDAEAIWLLDDEIVFVEERSRMVKTLDLSTFSLKQAKYISYNGGRNEGFESLAQKNNQHWLLFTEKNPVWMLEFNEQWQEVNRVKWNLRSDVSACTMHNGKTYLLSDESSAIWEVDLEKQSIVREFQLPMLNPEGLAFHPDGSVWVVSDDGQFIYTFVLPQ